MCRFIAYIGESVSPAPLVFEGDHSLYRQSYLPREMLSGSVNADGYGVAWYRSGLPVRIGEARPIWYDQGLEAMLEGVSSPVILAFLRNATPGLPVDSAGLAPMLLGRWSFGLNGFLADFRKRTMRSLRGLLPDELYAELRGVSDSESLFLLAVAHLRRGATPREALAEVIATALRLASEAGTPAQLNMVLSDGERIVLTRTGSEDATNSLHLARDVSFAPGGIVAATEPVDSRAGWLAVPDHSLVELAPGEEPSILPL